MRRRSLLAAATTALAASSGCIGVLTGKEPLERVASPARVPSSTREEAGYDLADTRSEELEREVTVGGETRQVRAVNEIAEYQRTVDLGALGEQEFAVFAVVATPAFEIGGQVMSPVERWSNRKIATTLQSQYSGLELEGEVGSSTVETLGEEIELSKFEGTASIEDQTGVDVFLHVGKVRHEEDFVLPIAVYPQRLSGEEETVLALVRSLDH